MSIPPFHTACVCETTLGGHHQVNVFIQLNSHHRQTLYCTLTTQQKCETKTHVGRMLIVINYLSEAISKP